MTASPSMMQLFLRAFGKVVSLRDVILEDCLLVQKELLDCSDFDAQQQHLEEEMRIAADLVRYCIEENALKVQDQAEYLMRYDQFTQRYEKLKKKYDALEAERQRRKENHDRLGAFIATMEQLTFTDSLWNTAIDHVTVFADKRLMFHFKNGSEVEVKVCK